MNDLVSTIAIRTHGDDEGEPGPLAQPTEEPESTVSPVDTQIPTPMECKGEGESVPLIPDPPECCDGLSLILPKSADTVGITGICTAKCGNAICDSETETSYNCAVDCEEEVTATPTPDKTPPSVSGVSVSDITETTVLITWLTDEPATSQVEYGPSPGYGIATSMDERLVNSHAISLTGLEASTEYHFHVVSLDAEGNESGSNDFTFNTEPQVWADDRIGIILNELKRANMYPDELRSSHASAVPSSEDHDYVAIYLIVDHITEGYVPANVNYIVHNSILVDSHGKEYACGAGTIQNVEFTDYTHLSASAFVIEGSVVILGFKLPQDAIPKMATLGYTFRESQDEGGSVSYSIDVGLEQ